METLITNTFLAACILSLILLIAPLICLYHIEKFKEKIVKQHNKLLSLSQMYEQLYDELNQKCLKQLVENGQVYIGLLKELGYNLSEIVEDHKKLIERQNQLHDDLLKEHEQLNEYFKNYS